MEKLYKAVLKHSELTNDDLKEISEHGADGGWCEFIYNVDCIRFWDNNSELIQKYSQEQAENMGHKNWLVMFSTFGRADMLDGVDGYKILGAWFILESVAHWFVDQE